MAIQTQTFEGLAGGMNVAQPAEEIADNEARYMQDILLHVPGLEIRRGPVSQIGGTPTFPTPVSGLVQVLDPTGANRLAVLRGDTVNGYLSVLNAGLSSYVDLPWNGALPTAPPANPYRIVDAKPAITGGTWIGTSSQYNANGPVQTLALWRGANVADYSTGTITTTRGSTTVTGSGTTWVGNVAPGSFLFANTDDGGTLTYAGVVKTVDSNTQVTLGVGSLYPITAKVYKFTSIRGFAPRVVKGRITASTGSTTVTGANTKFLVQGVGSGTWNLYRASDFAWVGKVTTVNTDTSITLAANAAAALNNERYYAFRIDADYNLSTMAVADRKVGFLNAVYAERNWYANLGQRFEITPRLWFSDPADPEAVDMAAFDGDFLDIGSSRGANSPIKAICPAYNALMVFKENETFGVFGSSPTQFEVRKVEDDGTLGGMSVQPWGGGVIWAGREGIHYFDGIQADNITAPKLGDYYKNLIRAFDPTTYRMWSMMERDHYFLFLEFAQPSIAVIKGATSSTPTKMTIVVNMNTKAFSLFTNVNVRGAVIMPADTGEETWFVVNGASSNLATFGKTAIGGSFASSLGIDKKRVNKFTLSEPGTITKATVYLHKLVGSGTQALRFVLYKDVGGIPDTATLVGASTEFVFNASTMVDGWFDFTFAAPPTLAAGNYWMGIWTGNTANIVGYAFDAGAASSWFSNAQTYNSVTAPSDPYGAPVSNSTDVMSQYITYVPSQRGYLVDTAPLFDSNGNDVIVSDGGMAGPDFYIESKKYNAGDAMRLKLFKMLAINYLAQGGSLKVDTVIGLNNIGRTSLTELPQTVFTWDQLVAQYGTWDNLGATAGTWDGLIASVFKPKRVKFLKRTQNLAFRIYQKTSSVSNVRIGPFHIGFKLQRPGRI